MSRTWRLGALVAMTFSVVSAPAFAGGVPGGRHGGGRIDESSPVPADFVVHISGPKGQEEFFPGFPKVLKGVFNPATGRYEAHTQAPNDPDAYDAWNDTIIKAPPGGVGNPGGGGGGGGGGVASGRSVLYIESTQTDAQGHVSLTQIFEALYAHQGTATLAIPDLYMTDANGQLVEGGVLYGLVDLSVYLQNPPPAFAFGDVFQVVNGVVAGLPGMRFGTDPFVFDAVNGTGFSDPAYSGYATAITRHDLTSVPEPAIWATMILGFAGAGAALRQERRRRADGVADQAAA